MKVQFDRRCVWVGLDWNRTEEHGDFCSIITTDFTLAPLPCVLLRWRRVRVRPKLPRELPTMVTYNFDGDRAVYTWERRDGTRFETADLIWGMSSACDGAGKKLTQVR